MSELPCHCLCTSDHNQTLFSNNATAAMYSGRKIPFLVDDPPAEALSFPCICGEKANLGIGRGVKIPLGPCKAAG